MFNKINRNEQRKIRHKRIRYKISGTASKPRLNVFRANANIYAQLIDDDSATTIVSASTREKGNVISPGGNIDAAKKVGEIIAERAKEKGISEIVFDRGGYLYHGRVKALADAAREKGLKF